MSLMPWLTRLVASPRRRAAALALALAAAVPAGHAMFGLYANLRSDLEALLPAESPAVRGVRMLRERMEFPALRDRIVAHSRLHNADKVILEDAGAGQHLWQELHQKRSLRPYKVRPEHDKVTRMVGQLGIIQDGEVFLPERTPWLETMLSEMRAFPSGTYDNQVDALSQLLQWIKDHHNFAPTRYDPETGRKLRHPRRPGTRRR